MITQYENKAFLASKPIKIKHKKNATQKEIDELNRIYDQYLELRKMAKIARDT